MARNRKSPLVALTARERLYSTPYVPSASYPIVVKVFASDGSEIYKFTDHCRNDEYAAVLKEILEEGVTLIASKKVCRLEEV